MPDVNNSWKPAPPLKPKAFSPNKRIRIRDETSDVVVAHVTEAGGLRWFPLGPLCIDHKATTKSGSTTDYAMGAGGATCLVSGLLSSSSPLWRYPDKPPRDSLVNLEYPTCCMWLTRQYCTPHRDCTSMSTPACQCQLTPATLFVPARRSFPARKIRT